MDERRRNSDEPSVPSHEPKAEGLERSGRTAGIFACAREARAEYDRILQRSRALERPDSWPELPKHDGAPNLLAARRWLVAAVVVVGVFALHALVPWLLHDDQPHPSTPQLVLWLVELPVAMAALSLTYRSSVRRRLGWGSTLLFSLAVSIVLATVATAATLFVCSKIGEHQREASFSLALVVGSALGVLQCGIWALAFVYPFAAEESRVRGLEAEQLRGSVELARLRSQLEPHFLLNTLNAISGLVTQNPQEARRLLACLGDLLSDALRQGDELQSVDREIFWLRRYAKILESRYAGILTFRWEVADDVGSALVPRLILQPLVENAVKHGALRRGSGGIVVVKIDRVASPRGARVVCAVHDNGPGVEDAPARPGALGLRAVRRRLELKCADASLELRSSAGGTEAVLELPFISGNAAIEMQTGAPTLARTPS